MIFFLRKSERECNLWVAGRSAVGRYHDVRPEGGKSDQKPLTLIAKFSSARRPSHHRSPTRRDRERALALHRFLLLIRHIGMFTLHSTAAPRALAPSIIIHPLAPSAAASKAKFHPGDRAGAGGFFSLLFYVDLLSFLIFYLFFLRRRAFIQRWCCSRATHSNEMVVSPLIIRALRATAVRRAHFKFPRSPWPTELTMTPFMWSTNTKMWKCNTVVVVVVVVVYRLPATTPPLRSMARHRLPRMIHYCKVTGGGQKITHTSEKISRPAHTSPHTNWMSPKLTTHTPCADLNYEPLPTPCHGWGGGGKKTCHICKVDALMKRTCGKKVMHRHKKFPELGPGSDPAYMYVLPERRGGDERRGTAEQSAETDRAAAAVALVGGAGEELAQGDGDVRGIPATATTASDAVHRCGHADLAVRRVQRHLHSSSTSGGGGWCWGFRCAAGCRGRGATIQEGEEKEKTKRVQKRFSSMQSNSRRRHSYYN